MRSLRHLPREGSNRRIKKSRQEREKNEGEKRGSGREGVERNRNFKTFLVVVSTHKLNIFASGMSFETKHQKIIEEASIFFHP